MIYTFYSYKGGVGRSMALVNIAELMYRAGLKVLMIDWDLEAPGLERFFPAKKVDEVLKGPGVMEMLLAYKSKASQFKPGPGNSLFPVFEIKDYVIDIHDDSNEQGRLWFLPAGRRAENQFFEYSNQVKIFDWQDFYQNWEGEIFFDWLREKFEDFADVVLIDSRTGVTEMSGVCTYQLADVIVMFCAANNQNIDGTLQMVRNFSDPQLQELRGGRPLQPLVIPARIERLSETERLNNFRRNFAKYFTDYIPQGLQTEPDFFIQVEIPYVPLYAFEEIIAVNQTGDELRSIEMERAYNKLLQVLVKLSRVDSVIRERLDVSAKESQNIRTSTGHTSAGSQRLKVSAKKSQNIRNIKIFISYASADLEKVRQLYQDLKEAGFQPWLDREDLLPGQDWKYAIRQAIRESSFFLACLSNNSVEKRGFVQTELKIGLDIFKEFPGGKIFLIPVRLEECSIPESFSTIHWVDYFKPDGFEKLSKALNTQKNKSSQRSKKSKSKSTPLSSAVSPQPATLKFKNREHELEEIRNPGGAKLMVIDAPPGYGKSQLLIEVEKWCKIQRANEWVCARLDLRLVRRDRSLLNEIAEQIIGPAQIATPEELIGSIIDQKKHILLLFDAAEANPAAIKWVQEHFIPPLMESLKYTSLIGRVVFAGQYLCGPGRNWGSYKIMKLTVLDEDIVQEAVREALKQTPLSDEIKNILAKEVFRLSCGHPGIIEDILQNPPIGGWPLAIKGKRLKADVRNKIFQKCARPVIEEILSETGDEYLGQVLKILSIFRRFDLGTIQSLQTLAGGQPAGNTLSQSLAECGDINLVDLLAPFNKIRTNAMELLTNLAKTGLVSAPTREKPFYHDSIIRELILTQMQFEEANRYAELNALAWAIYQTWLDDKNVDSTDLPVPLTDERQTDYMAEGLYHLLNSLMSRERGVENKTKIETNVTWYVKKLRSSFGYDHVWLQQNLCTTLERDEDILVMLPELVGEEETQRIFDKLTASA